MGDHGQWPSDNPDRLYKGVSYHLGWTQLGIGGLYQGAIKVTGTQDHGAFKNDLIRNVPSTVHTEEQAIDAADVEIKKLIDNGQMNRLTEEWVKSGAE
jgi:hypothetical protein